VLRLPSSKKIAAGFLHSCAIKPDGAVTCWGADFLGQLGDGDYGDRSLPVDVSGLSGVVDIDGGDSHTCAVLGDGGVACWGDDRRGELGDGVSALRVPASPKLPCP
jgi:alpha-tubulin suppressor-like RCC1 family protein